MMTNPTTTPDTGWMGDRSRGASMGRDEFDFEVGQIPAKSVYLSRVKIDSDGYDPGGAYWGIGTPLYCAHSDGCDYCQYVRAHSREDAAVQLGLSDRELKKPLIKE